MLELFVFESILNTSGNKNFGITFKSNTNSLYVFVGIQTLFPFKVALTAISAILFESFFKNLGTLSISSWIPLEEWKFVIVYPGQTAVDVIPIWL